MSTMFHSSARAAFAAAVLTLGVATGAHADGAPRIGVAIVPDDDHQEAVVLSFAPTQLSTSGGIAELHREITRAAQHVCGAYVRWEGGRDATECRIEAANDAEKSLGVLLARQEAGTRMASTR